jgi:5-deoxy-glucuronate isomerase
MAESLAPITLERCLVRDTAARKGRTRSVAPGATAARHLHYGRIILEPADAPLRFASGTHETALIALKGQAAVTTAGRTFTLVPYDALYVPRDSEIEVRPSARGCDLAEISAEVQKRYPLQHVVFAEIQKDAGLHFKAGAPPTERMLNILIGKNVEAGRLLAGVTFSTPGNWTSWPPHEHALMLEEAYLYIDMPAPSFGLQLVYSDPRSPELAVVVREGDVVLMPQGYHPNVAAPGGSINFLWMMAAHREGEDRQFGVVNVQPEYAGAGSGLEAGRAQR